MFYHVLTLRRVLSRVQQVFRSLCNIQWVLDDVAGFVLGIRKILGVIADFRCLSSVQEDVRGVLAGSQQDLIGLSRIQQGCRGLQNFRGLSSIYQGLRGLSREDLVGSWGPLQGLNRVSAWFQMFIPGGGLRRIQYGLSGLSRILQDFRGLIRIF